MLLFLLQPEDDNSLLVLAAALSALNISGSSSDWTAVITLGVQQKQAGSQRRHAIKSVYVWMKLRATGSKNSQTVKVLSCSIPFL